MNGQSWTLETELNRVGGDSGWIATQVMKTISSDGRMRRWQWEYRAWAVGRLRVLVVRIGMVILRQGIEVMGGRISC